jgi:hypothetical protein
MTGGETAAMGGKPHYERSYGRGRPPAPPSATQLRVGSGRKRPTGPPLGCLLLPGADMGVPRRRQKRGAVGAVSDGRAIRAHRAPASGRRGRVGVAAPRAQIAPAGFLRSLRACYGFPPPKFADASYLKCATRVTLALGIVNV